MSNDIKVSVVVPVYNREKYFRQCVDSIVAQTLKEIEIILVDDGSTDGSPAICDEYAAKDPRVKVIHKQNAGMGVAYNTGMAKAKGEYIGFVESDDWIEPEMYEELYNKAVEQDVDMVKSLYTNVNGEKTNLVNQYGKRRFNQRLENLSMTAPEIATSSHPAVWSAIYNRTFIERYKIQYAERPGASFQDIDFNWQVITQVRSCYLVPKSYYNYRVDASDSSNNARGDKVAMNAMSAWRDTFTCLLANNANPQFLELCCKRVFDSAKFHNLRNCKGVDKIKQAKAVARIFTPHLSNMQYTRFSQPEKKEFLCMLRHPVWYGLKQLIYKKESNPAHAVAKFLGIKLYEKKKTAQCDKRKLLYLPIKKEIVDKQGSKIFYLGLPLVRATKKGNVIEKRFLGIRYKTKQCPTPFAQDLRMLRIITHANAITNTHRETFTKYKNCHAGQDIALVATGPTLDYFESIKGCVYVGVNKAVSYDKIHFDYLFFQDYAHVQAREILGLISRYEGAKKFYGILQDMTRQDWIVPESAAIRDKAERYYLVTPSKYTYDIANEPFGDRYSVSFAAMQFILWTNPRRIYLVGQDNTMACFDHSMADLYNHHRLREWKEMAQFANTYYPDTEIISINPVSLKGVFKDMYTRSYLAEHQELKIEERNIITGELS